MKKMFLSHLSRIADALERMAPPAPEMPDLSQSRNWVWDGEHGALRPVTLKALDIGLLHGIDHVKDILLQNSLQFAKGFPANNALLWGARGMGKSSLVKAVAQMLQASYPLHLIEIHKDELNSLPRLMEIVASSTDRFVLFCDELSFDAGDDSYKSLKSILDGSIAGRPANVVVYATSNRRHLMPREMIENEQRIAIHSNEAAEEKVSLSDRFGLWLGFHACDQETYLAMVDEYAASLGITQPQEDLHRQAKEWAATRGGRSGRIAWQFIQDIHGKSLLAG